MIMKTGFWNYIANFFSQPKKTFVLSDCDEGIISGRKATRGADVDFYTDYKKLLLHLHRRANQRNSYNSALIYKNGSTSKAAAVSSFIKEYDPSIKTIIFDSEKDLRNKLMDYNI